MSALLKDIFSVSFFDELSIAAKSTLPQFNKKEFLTLIYDDAWEAKALKERVRHIAQCLQHFMPTAFNQSSIMLLQLTDELQKQRGGAGGFEFMFLPDFVQQYGQHDYKNSVKCIERITQFISCEYAIRPLIMHYEKQAIPQLIAWSKHKNHHVRRLASEGSRPRLPWGMALPNYKKDPSPILPILHQLKNDPSEYVRRSVANNLNDIAKDNPNVVLKLAEEWKGISEQTDPVIKHGCRTLLKQGHAHVLNYFGLNSNQIKVTNFSITLPQISVGQYLEFTFDVQNNSKIAQTLRLEYAVHYLRNNGQHNKKVFKISERVFEPNEQQAITRKQSFKPITTRKFYAGTQRLSIIVNGKEFEVLAFELN